MSLKFRVVQRPDMTKDAKEGAKKYYGSISATGMLTLEQLCSSISAYSTASQGDVKLVLDGMVYIASEALLRGEIVQLGDLGHFQLKMSSESVDSSSDFKASMFYNPRITFRPSTRLKKAIADVSVEKWPVITVTDSSSSGNTDEAPEEL